MKRRRFKNYPIDFPSQSTLSCVSQNHQQRSNYQFRIKTIYIFFENLKIILVISNTISGCLFLLSFIFFPALLYYFYFVSFANTQTQI